MRDDLHLAALDALLEPDPAAKQAAVAALVAALAADRLAPAAFGQGVPPRSIPVPGRPARPALVAPAELARRRSGSAAGRASLIHAVAHIEFNAINLALDAVYRFRGLPLAFYADWLGVAADEARHFGLLSARLAAYGCTYGDFPAHDGLWQMALATAGDCLTRMALVPRVLEARGLDVTPAMIERLVRAGDIATADVLRVILDDEVRHVAIGSAWFTWCCERRGLEPEATFIALVERHAAGAVRPPFNREARLRSGFRPAELDNLESVAPSAG